MTSIEVVFFTLGTMSLLYLLFRQFSHVIGAPSVFFVGISFVPFSQKSYSASISFATLARTMLTGMQEEARRFAENKNGQSDVFKQNVLGASLWARMIDDTIKNNGQLDVTPTLHRIGCKVEGGFTQDSKKSAEVWYLHASRDGSLLTVAPTCSGKGWGQIVTKLLSWPGSTVVLNNKGESWQATAGWRMYQGMGVRRLAPFSPTHSETWNPLDQTTKCDDTSPNSPERQESAQYLAVILKVISVTMRK